MENAFQSNLRVDAELEDPGLPAPLPGLLFVISIMRYRVLDILEGEYPHEVIFVGHHNADLNDPQFAPGVHHRMSLTREFPENASLLNKFGNESSEGGPFYCQVFEVIQ